jgi:hypothetical protein
MKDKPYGGTLEQWSLNTIFGVTYATGHVYGDTRGRFADGDFISTSQVVEYSKGVKRLITLNTLYILGEPR